MSERKRKISVRKVLQTLLTLIVVSGFAMAMISADRMQSNKRVHAVHVVIRNRHMVHFLDEAAVMKMLFQDRHINPRQTRLAALDVHRMEQIVRSNPWVSDAQVYVDNERDVHVFVTQRVPVARIFEESNNSYYLDTALKAMPLSEQYVHYTPLVTGTPQLRDDSAGLALKGNILGLVNYIARSRFWNAQIAQIVMTPDHSFELIPVLGKQRIILGDTTRLAAKLNNLLAFYVQVQNKVGWEKYETIDLRYEGQVVASPALKWKAPVDRALSNMNWVKAVMEAGSQTKDESGVADDSAIRLATPPAHTAATVAPPAKPRPATPTAASAPGPKPPPGPAAKLPLKTPKKPAPGRKETNKKPAAARPKQTAHNTPKHN